MIEKKRWESLSDKMLLVAYWESVNLLLDQEFIEMLFQEILKRKLNIDDGRHSKKQTPQNFF
ncbi:sporulation histidine kinase inhibitor Sda [Paenibacillus sp. SI8]|uniref:sporulation histidine kinase inhibitor Sda n=1 Tax=unclassified Paenibacillus TaxID=185978 RepID=UPI00346562AF